MARLKELRTRKVSVQSTRKITSAMKMISAAKLKKAQEQVELGRPYSDLMNKMIRILLAKTSTFKTSPPLLVGRGRFQSHLLIVLTSDRGLCGGFNASILRETQKLARGFLESRQDLKIFCVGRRAHDSLKKEFGAHILETFPSPAKPRFRDAHALAKKVLELFDTEQIDVCRLVYNTFVSALIQQVNVHTLIPFSPLEKEEETKLNDAEENILSDQFIFEPGEEVVMKKLLPQNVAVQIYRALMESAASEQAARMTAMDNATRNASEMIKTLELQYNRLRQAYITKELIEIISGAEAL